MALAGGTRIGPYEIVAPIGAGGMGEVYRARDTRLKRDVALKVLPATVAGDPERLARFQREAEVLAALNHPHIAHIHGLEESDGAIALVMELVDGEDLSARIARGPMAVDEALPIALQIADALDAAHERGIIHRDLKPANIKVRADGTVKVLDFGLAKAMDPAGGGSSSGGSADLMNSPTITSPMTQMGMILGTAAYMSPEQARGRAVDRRADIWAFGCVLYEMLTGRRPFEGDTITDVIAAIVKTEPDWDALPPGVPRAVRATLRRCLAKDPKQRLRDIGDARFEIAEPGAPDAAGPPASAASPAPRWTAAVVLTVVAALAAGAAGGVVWRTGRDAAPVRWTGERLGGPAIAMQPRVSPDGQLLAFTAMVDGQSQVAVMKPGTGSWTVLTSDRSKGLQDALAWSHDGSRIYYDRMTDTPQGIYSVPALGGEERLVIENASRPEPLPDGSLLLLRANDSRQLQLHRLYPDTGRLEALPALSSSTFDGNFVRPIGGDRVAIFGRPLSDAASPEQLYLLSLGPGALTRFGPDLPSRDVASMAFDAANRSVLVAMRDGSAFSVLAVPVDGGEAREAHRFFTEPFLDVSPDGSLFAALRDRPAEVVRFHEDRLEAERLVTGPTLFGGAVALPDGRYLITERLGTTSHVLIARPGRESARLVETSEDNRGPMTPVGGDRAALMIGPIAAPEIAIVAVNSGRILKRLKAPGNVTSLGASPDGATLYASSEGSIVAMPVDGGSARTLGAGDSLTVDPATGDLIVKLDEAERYRLVRMSPAGGTPAPITITGDLRLVTRPLMPGAVRNGRLVLPIAVLDSWYWFAGVLDLRSGRLTRMEVVNPTDFHWITWAADGSVLGSGMAIRSALWKFTREAAR
ncbi:MAG TPA: protein kinase [Vicinamibacterales bacterium]|nr:protein kinase [Vicinamibacterales bacterium]